MDAVARILSARTHFDVLELQPPAATEPAAVRRKYKTLAMLVHPDKNRGDGAEAAFKRLSEAYECLVDAQTQRAYLAELARGAKPQRRPPPPPPPRSQPRPTQPWPPTKPRKTKRKTPPPPPPPPPPQAAAAAPRRWRTPEEIWAQFQREEENQARREFMVKGFDRDFEQRDGESASKRAKRADREDVLEPRDVPACVVDDDAVENHAREWMSWKRTRVEDKSEQEATVAAEVIHTQAPPSPVVCCMICRRKFATETALGRHEQLSALHKQNLQQIHEENVAATSAVSS